MRLVRTRKSLDPHRPYLWGSVVFIPRKLERGNIDSGLYGHFEPELEAIVANAFLLRMGPDLLFPFFEFAIFFRLAMRNRRCGEKLEWRMQVGNLLWLIG
jgi:hypothetical protein